MKRRRQPPQTYTIMHELMASPTEPLPEASRRHQLTRMWLGLANIETAAEPTTDDWRVCSDAVNLMETMVVMGEVQDSNRLLPDAVMALALAGKRHTEKGTIRLDARGIQAVRAVLEDYAEIVAVLPARTMMRCHRLTEQRIRAILNGKRLAHDVEVVDL